MCIKLDYSKIVNLYDVTVNVEVKQVTQDYRLSQLENMKFINVLVNLDGTDEDEIDEMLLEDYCDEMLLEDCCVRL